MKQTNRYRYFRLLLLTALLSAAMVSCSKEDREPQVQGEGVELRLSTAVDNSFSLPQDATKSPVVGTNLPAGTHLLSIAIFKSDKATAWGAGYDNIKAEVNVNNYGAQTWRFQLKGSSEWRNFLSFPEGTTGDMWITALYPYSASTSVSGKSDATLQYVVNLSTAEQQASQDDVMYAAPQKLTLVAGDRSKALLLSFKHAFALFEFQIAPIFNDPCKITKVTLSNGTAETWVSDRATVLSTGVYTSSSYSNVTVTDSRTMTMGAYNTYSVMLPSKSLDISTYHDGGITVNFTEGLNSAILPSPLPIKKEWLTAAGGLKAGNRYTFKMVYHNSSTGSGGMTVTGWTVNGEQVDNWGEVPPDLSGGYLLWTDPELITSGNVDGTVNITSTTTSYNGYTYDESNANNNGGYESDFSLIFDEPAYHRLEVAPADEGCFTWTDAWAACKAKAPTEQWRLPRASELVLIYLNKTVLDKTPGFTHLVISYDGNDNGYYWAGREESSDNSWYMSFVNAFTDYYDKTGIRNVRCVREIP